MQLAKISLKNIQYRPLSSALSIILLAFGTGIIVLLMAASEQIDKQFTRNIRGIDMVVGAKGSPLQLVLSSVYHVDDPTGNIDQAEFNKLARHPMVEQAIPLAYGDNYRGFRIVGTEPSYPERYDASLAEGRWWEESGEVVLGAAVDKLEPMPLGSEFHSSHGVAQSIESHDHFPYRVVGRLAPTGTVIDKLILTGIESVWAVHEHEPGEEAGQEKREITAGLISFKSAMGNLMLPRLVNENTNMQAALPAIEYNRLYSLMEGGVALLRALAILIVVISAASVFISLYQSLRDRRYELALIRSLGAGRLQLFSIILLEGLLIAFAGYLCGLIFGKLGFMFLSQIISTSYQYDLSLQAITSDELWLLPGVLALGFLAALAPAWRAYQLDISKTLSDA